MREPRYPVYIPSKGRAANTVTAKMFETDGVAFRVVVEPQEVELYEARWGRDRVLSLPENNRGLVYSRNWIKEHAVAGGHARHWQFDDDVKGMIRLHCAHRIPCTSAVALQVAEDFVDRYENVALASFNSWFFTPTNGILARQWPPFALNTRCYTCFLMLNELPNRWRGRYNEDTDMTLQVLADGWCTILFNAFSIRTASPMLQQGGQTDIYLGDGRLEMARELERRWPGVVDVRRRFGRPQHVVKAHWQKFDTPLRRRPDFQLPDGPNEYGLRLRVVREVKSETLRELVKREQDR